MKNEHQRPFMNPSPLPFDFLSNDASTPFFSNLAISPCPFCHQRFELAWDCKIVFYKHAYHSWCAIFHFSSSSKCLFKGCGDDMHTDWWVLLGIKKPCGNDKGRKGGDWITITLLLNDLQGDFIELKNFCNSRFIKFLRFSISIIS
jgi:hypothetical protein